MRGLLDFGGGLAQPALVAVADPLEIVPVLPDEHGAGDETVHHIGV